MFLRITKILFLLLIVSLPLVRPFNTQIFGLFVPYTDFIFLGAAAFWLLSIVRGEAKFYFDKFYLYLGFYALALVISTFFSINPTLSFHKLLGEFYLISLAILTFNLAHEEDFIRRTSQAFCFGTFLTILGCLAGFVLFYAGYKTRFDNYFLSHLGSLPTGNYPRIQSFFANPNMMADFLNISIIFLLLAEKLGWLNKFVAGVLFYGTIFASFFTLSPGIGGIALSLGLWFSANFSFEKLTTKARISLIAGLFLAIAFLGATIISPDTENTNQDFTLPFIGKKIEPSVRVLIWENTLETVKSFPFFGKGTGTDVANLQYTTLSGDNQTLLEAHNVWLNVLGQFGLFGFVTFLGLCGFLLLQCRIHLTDKTEKSFLRLALTCAFIGAFGYQGLVGSFEDARHLWILFGLMSSLKS